MVVFLWWRVFPRNTSPGAHFQWLQIIRPNVALCFRFAFRGRYGQRRGSQRHVDLSFPLLISYSRANLQHYLFPSKHIIFIITIFYIRRTIFLFVFFVSPENSRVLSTSTYFVFSLRKQHDVMVLKKRESRSGSNMGKGGLEFPLTHRTHGYPLSPPFNFFVMVDKIECAKDLLF